MPVEEIKATRTRYEREDALRLLDGVDELYVAQGRRLLHFERSGDWPDDDTIAGLILGRSGTLRAPVIRVGRITVVGFNDEAYQKVLIK